MCVVVDQTSEIQALLLKWVVCVCVCACVCVCVSVIYTYPRIYMYIYVYIHVQKVQVTHVCVHVCLHDHFLYIDCNTKETKVILLVHILPKRVH